MTWKVVTFFGIALLALSAARPPVSKQSVKIENYKKLSHVGSQEPEHHEVYAWTYPSYEFKYEVDDPHTHDFKGHHESRNGDEVKGEYWLIQPDGLKRTVKYYADKSSGLKAHVDYNKPHYSEENNEESASVEEDNSNTDSSSIENENGNNEEGENESQNNESDSENEDESASLGEQKENENEWRRNGVNFWGQRRGHEESGDDQNDNDEDNEQEAKASKQDEQESENGEESYGNEGQDSGNEESSPVENKKHDEKQVIKNEYHFIIHHPKYNKKLKH